MMDAIDPDAVFAALEAERVSGRLSDQVTTATVRYQGSVTHPGKVERINEDGTVELGTFSNGQFTPL